MVRGVLAELYALRLILASGLLSVKYFWTFIYWAVKQQTWSPILCPNCPHDLQATGFVYCLLGFGVGLVALSLLMTGQCANVAMFVSSAVARFSLVYLSGMELVVDGIATRYVSKVRAWPAYWGSARACCNISAAISKLLYDIPFRRC